MADPAIVTRGLTKVFPPKRRGLFQMLRRERPKPARAALVGVDLEVRRGELFGLLGPNGAGKTTLVKILSTLLLPTEGEATIAGLDVRKDATAVRKRVGVVLGGDRALYWRLTGRENLWYFSQLYDMPSDHARKRIDEVLQQVDLLDRADDRVENYSKGMKQRLHIARGLLTDPDILLLDEPTIGLDPHAARSLRALVRKLVDELGRTVVLTTHYLYEADELSDRVGILHQGKLIALGTPAQLKATHASDKSVVVRVRGSVEGLGPGKTDPSTRITTYRAPGELDPARVPQLVAKSGAELVGLAVEEPSLEDVFVALTGEGISSSAKHEGDDD
ncbi:MAG TPA: ABC transporter ATP-binding protein [Candidatus Thermoplasmatota archaeon]|nr:ABC transporter ATP-binding protein [Candidatus Thermoplasmatota archaeon]